MKGFKVTDANMQCLSYQYEIGKDFKISGKLEMCNKGFHFCELVNHCFNYYTFSSQNRVFEIEASGEIETRGDKSCCSSIKFLRELTWDEVLKLANTGIDNTGHSNSGSWNSGSWNSGDRNSGDSNSGYRNSGAFCTDKNSYVILFDKPSKIRVKDWENTEVVRIMSNLDTTLWIPSSMMSDAEKKSHPKFETAEGYLKTIPIKEAWANLWGNLDDKKKKLFTSLDNFDAKKFKEITGINTKQDSETFNVAEGDE